MEKHRKFAYIIFVLGVLILSLSVYSILVDSVYGTAERLSFRATDFSNLFFGVPYLLIGAYLLYAQKDVWLWVVPGALFYAAYVYLPYAIALEVSVLFLAYLLVIVVSLYLIIILLASQDYREFDKVVLKAPVRLITGILLLLGVFVALRQSALAVAAVLNATSATLIDRALWIDDLLLGCPPMILSAVYLIKRKGIGYVAGPAMLLCYGVLSLSLIPYFILEKLYTRAAFQWDGSIIIIGMALLCLVPFVRFMRWRKSGTSAE